MPSQPQNRARKAMRGSRRLTTISFESLERINRGVFTEDISSSSRIARPSFVLRQGTVVTSNMPETIKLANHRGKIYVGISETTSQCSSQRDSTRCVSRDKSAATTIGKASIIDWADSASDISSRVPLSGELTSLLPPVPRPQQQKYQSSPGLDMTEILNYKTTKYLSSCGSNRRQGQRSPHQSPPRGGGTKLLGGFRPPQNTPFTLPTRPDDFSASFRKNVIPKSPRNNVNVMILGGGITPVPPSRQDTHRSFLSRDGTMTDRRRLRQNQPSLASLGSANFDLPMIDLKCVESPVGNLGNLEEKGIRLVKLRRVKRTKKRSESQSSDGRGGGSSATTPSEGKRNSLKEEQGKDYLSRSTSNIPRPPPTSREITMNKTAGGDTLELERTISEKRSEGNNLLSPRSITSSTLSEACPPRDLNNDSQSDIGSNHDHYSTPLLPNTGRSTSRSDKQKPLISPVIQINSEPIKDQIPVFQMTVEKVDVTPDLPIPAVNVTEEDDIPASFTARRGKRSSSLSVPTSDLSEIRPGRYEQQQQRKEALSPVQPEPKDMEHLASRTIATQTGPLEE